MYLERNVFDAALDRINMIFDDFDDVIVNMSGGKDSTVLYEMTKAIARERNRLPLKVFWLDQEVEWQSTVNYVKKIMYSDDVEPLWYQVPFRFPNNTSNLEEYLLIWDPEKEDKWIHPADPISYKELKFKVKGNQDKDFYKVINQIPQYHITGKSGNVAVLDGLRIDECPTRRLGITAHAATFRNYTWANYMQNHVQRFHPIYDFAFDDIWTAIAKNKWEYNQAYDTMYQYGIPKNRMRVSALTHETAYKAISMLQEFEPQTYNRFVERMGGIQSANQAFSNYASYIPTELPYMFKNWKEYRDYLLVHIVKPEYWDIFRNRWKNQEDDYYYRMHVSECIVNDTCGTINKDYVIGRELRESTEKTKSFVKGLMKQND